LGFTEIGFDRVDAVLIRSYFIFILLPIGVLDSNPILEAIMADLPAVIFFYIYTVIVIRWAEIYHFSRKIKSKGDQVLPYIIGINVFIILAFIAFLIAYFATQTSEITCGDGTGSNAPKLVSLAYKIVFAIFCVFAVIGFSFYGYGLIKLLVDSMKSVSDKKSRLSRVYQIGLLTIICSLGLLAQAIFRIVSTFIPPESRISLTTFIIIFVVITECLPGLTVIFIFHKRFENLGKDKTMETKRTRNEEEMKSQ